MAMLASKSPYPAPLGGTSSQPSAQYNSSVSSYRNLAAAPRTEHFFASPTESEFSELYDAPDSIR
jgi:mitogen-activated protein kinase kinase kinase